MTNSQIPTNSPEIILDDDGYPTFSSTEAGSKDTEAWHAWKANPGKKTFTNLYQQVLPIVKSRVSSLSSKLPESALMLESVGSVKKAAETFEPDRGIKFSTHLVNHLKKVYRYSYSYQDSARVSEHLREDVPRLNLAKNDLEADLGRAPTHKELAGHLNWTVKRVSTLESRLMKEHYESGNKSDVTHTAFNNDIVFRDYLRSVLSREENNLLTLLEKYPKSEGRVSATKMAADMGVTVNRYNYLKRKLATSIEEAQKGFKGL